MSGSDVYGTWDDVFGEEPAEIGHIGEALAAAIRSAHPETVEVVRPRERTVVFGWGPKKMSEGYAYIMPQKGRVNLGFFKGAALDDPAGLLEGSGAAMRHVKVADKETAGSGPVADLIKAAIVERGTALGRL